MNDIKLINNESKKVDVSIDVYNALQKEYDNGLWCAIIKDVNGKPHSIILENNFQ